MSCVYMLTITFEFVFARQADLCVSLTVSPSLSVSTASGERADALPQAPECTDRTGLFKEAAGMDISRDTIKFSLFPLAEQRDTFWPSWCIYHRQMKSESR